MSTNNPQKRTAPQVALLHAGESVAVSASVTFGYTIYQYIATNGFNLSHIGAVAGVAFITMLATIYKPLMSNQNLAPAVADTVEQFKQDMQLLLSSHFQSIYNLFQQQVAQAPTQPPAVSPFSLLMNPGADTTTSINPMMLQNMNASAQTQQNPFSAKPPSQFAQPTPGADATTRRFGDSGIIPIPPR